MQEEEELDEDDAKAKDHDQRTGAGARLVRQDCVQITDSWPAQDPLTKPLVLGNGRRASYEHQRPLSNGRELRRCRSEVTSHGPPADEATPANHSNPLAAKDKIQANFPFLSLYFTIPLASAELRAS